MTLADGTSFELDHGAVTIAAITSCTNTSNPSVMIGAALLAKKAVEKGLERKPWVKTTLAPGSKVVSDYYDKSGLTPYLDKLGFNLVGYGCTTCIGNSGPLIPEVSQAVNDNDLAVVSVLSGNRNFEGRINPDIKMNYLASPPLVVAYALAGSMDVDLFNDPLGQDTDGNDVFMKDIWPTAAEVEDVIAGAITSEMFDDGYQDVFAGDEAWQSLPTPEGKTFAWDPESTYVRKPPYFDGMPDEAGGRHRHRGRAGAAQAGRLGHHRPHQPGRRDQEGLARGQVPRRARRRGRDFNSYGSRRGNHEVMIRGTFANIRLRNQLAPGTEGGFTRDFTLDDAPVTHDLRGVGELHRGRHPAGRAVRQGVRLRLVARLGGQGHLAAGREGRHRRVLRADPPLQPDRHGRHPAAVPRGRERRVARPHRRGDLLDLRDHRAQRGPDAEDRQGRRPATCRSTRSSASTPPARRTTTATAASCSTCSATSERRPPDLPPSRHRFAAE